MHKLNIAAVVAALLACQCEAAERRRPNVVFLLAGHTYYHYKGHIRDAYMGVTENRADATDGAVGVYSTDLYIAKAKSLIRRHVANCRGIPFFLYLAVNTIHGSGRGDATLPNAAPLHVPGRPYPANGVEWPLAPEPPELRNT